MAGGGGPVRPAAPGGHQAAGRVPAAGHAGQEDRAGVAQTRHLPGNPTAAGQNIGLGWLVNTETASRPFILLNVMQVVASQLVRPGSVYQVLVTLLPAAPARLRVKAGLGRGGVEVAAGETRLLPGHSRSVLLQVTNNTHSKWFDLQPDCAGAGRLQPRHGLPAEGGGLHRTGRRRSLHQPDPPPVLGQVPFYHHLYQQTSLHGSSHRQ